MNGRISKVLEVSDLLEEPNVKYYKTGKFTGFCSTEKYNVKHSKDIIDLIEKDDYVNGEKVTDIREWKSSKDGAFRYAVTVYHTIIRPDEIKSIITKEQIKQIEYKVKE